MGGEPWRAGWRRSGILVTPLARQLGQPLSRIIGRLEQTSENGVSQSVSRRFEKRKLEDVQMVVDLHTAGRPDDRIAAAIDR
jgi:hypothetical protein